MNAIPPAARPHRHWLRGLSLVAALLVLLLASGLSWLLCTGSGLRFALSQAQRFTHGALEAKQAKGRLTGPIDIALLRYDDGKGTAVLLTHVHLDWQVATLLSKSLRVFELRVARLDVAWAASQARASSSRPFSLTPPVELALDRVHIGPIVIKQGGKPLFTAHWLELSGSWTRSGIKVNKLALRAPEGRLNFTGQLDRGPHYRGQGLLDIAWKLGQSEYIGTLKAQGDGRHAKWRLNLTQPMAAQWQLDLSQSGNYAWTSRLDIPPFNPKPLLGGSLITRLGANLQGSGDQRSGTVTGQLDLNAYRVMLQPLQASLDKDLKRLSFRQLRITSPQIKGMLHATGTVQFDERPLSADLAIDWQGVKVPADLVGQLLASEGHVVAKGSADAYHAEGEVMIGPPGKLDKLVLNMDGTSQRMALHTLSLKQSQGNFSAQGTLTLQPVSAWQLQAKADKFDPGQLFAGWSGSLDADLSTQGELAKQGTEVKLDVRKLQGRLRHRQLRGAGYLHLSPNRVLDGMLDLASGNSSVKLRARPGQSNDASVTLAMASLNDWLPNAAGALNGQFNLRGRYPNLAVSGSLQGQALGWGKQRAQQLQLKADIPDINSLGGRLELHVMGVEWGGLAFKQIDLHTHGSSAQHQLTLDAQGAPLSLSLTLNGALKGENWTGTLASLTLDVQGLPRWRLQQAAQLGWHHGRATLGPLCLTAGEPLLCLNGARDQAGNVHAGYRLHAVPLGLIAHAAGSTDVPLSAEGTLEGDGELRRTAAGVLTGSASIDSAQGRIIYHEPPDQPLLSYRDLALKVSLAPGSQEASVHAALNGKGRLDARITVTGPQQALGGQLSVHLDDLAFISLFTDALANVKGRVDGEFRLAGTLTAPAMIGQAGVSGFAAEVPDAGLKLSDGRLVASTNDARALTIEGSVQSGKGALTVHGTAALDAQTPTILTLKGADITVIDIPAAKVVLTPDLIVRRNAQGIQANGSIRLDSADVNLDKLPGGGVNQASSDMVVVDEPQASPSRAPMPIYASIKVDLGQHARVVGRGLDGWLSGMITVDERPGRATTGQGQVTVNGTYKAYGQNLAIQQGQLLFASTPIDNPGLNIKAVRNLQPQATINEGQEVGLKITGTAKRPILNVFSNPPIDQSDALAYLITGKPFSQVSGDETSMMNQAAQALGSATGNLLAKSIGSKLGIEDIGVSSSEALNGASAFTVGKYLSPRLYLSYGIGLFEPGQVITLRYRISQHWNFEAQNATDFNRASFNYRIEK